MMVEYNELEDKEDFEIIKYAIRKTKNSRDMTLKILARIMIESDDPNENSITSVSISRYSIYIYLYNIINFKIMIS